MEPVRQWSFSLCITLVVSVVITLLLPTGSVGKYGKIIVSLFIFLSLLLPFGNIDALSISIDDFDEATAFVSQEDTYGKLLEVEIQRRLAENGYSGCTVSCTTATNETGEIEITQLSIHCPDVYDSSEIKQFVYDTIGIATEVYHLGE